MAMNDRVFVRLARDESGFPPWDEEELWALEQVPGRFIVDAVPTFATELSHRDVVAAACEGGRWMVTTVVERSGHSTVQVVLFQDDAHDEVYEVGIRNGGVVNHTELQGYFAIDLPPDADFSGLARDLAAGFKSGKWDFREGHISDVHRKR